MNIDIILFHCFDVFQQTLKAAQRMKTDENESSVIGLEFEWFPENSYP